ncbi:MAG: Rv3235 family protein [Motilibacteraceae bacterium]
MSTSSAAALQDTEALPGGGAVDLTASTSGSGAPAATTRLRRIPTPQCEPPYEQAVTQQPAARLGRGMRGAGDGRRVPPRQGTLALAFALPGGLPTQPAPAPLPARPALRLVTTAAPAAPGVEDDEDEDFVPTPRCELPDPNGWARRLTQALLEVLAGNRPAAQLVRWTSAEVLAGLTAQVGALARATSAPAAGAVRHHRPTVRSVRVSEVCDGVAEVSAVVVRGGRAGALALRLEGRDGRWQCTAFEAG